MACGVLQSLAPYSLSHLISHPSHQTVYAQYPGLHIVLEHPSAYPPQDLELAVFSAWNTLHSHIPMAHSPSSLRSLLRYPLMREGFPGHQYKKAPSLPSGFIPLNLIYSYSIYHHSAYNIFVYLFVYCLSLPIRI